MSEIAPEAPIGMLNVDDLFDDLVAEFDPVDMAERAQQALGGILTIEDENGNLRTAEQIRTEIEIYFSNPIIAESMELLTISAITYAAFCAHNVDVAEELNSGPLSVMDEFGRDVQRDHDDEHECEDDDEEDEDDDAREHRTRK